MLGIVLISHAHIATEMKAAVEHILGVQVAFEAVDVPNSDVSKEEEKKLRQLVESCDTGKGVLVMVDLFGATPCNIALKLAQTSNIEVVAGFNLPAVIKAVTFRHKDIKLRELAETSISAGQQYMCMGSQCKRPEVKA